MILFNASKARRLIWVLLPTIMLLIPLMSSAQDLTPIKRLQRISFSYYNNDGEPRTIHTHNQTYYYDPVNPFQINSYMDYVGVGTTDGTFMYMEDTFNFSSVTNFSPDYFTYSSPTLIYFTVRTCKLDNAGFMLEDNYAYDSPPYNEQIVNKYIYNANMKLTAKLRSDSYNHKHWKTECVLDSLDRRVTEINYTSVDSINWSPTRKLEYFYSNEPITHPYQFEKYNLYAPDDAFYNNLTQWETYDYDNVQTSPFYLCDSWIIDHYNQYYFHNGAWELVGSHELGLDHPGLIWTVTIPNGFANLCTWDDAGMPIRMVSGDLTCYDYSLTYSPPSALEDTNEGVPAAFSVCAYPNPNKGQTQLSIKTDKQQSITVHTYNVRGQKLKEQSVTTHASGTTSIDWQATDSTGKSLPNGIYLLKFHNADHIQVKRITVAK